MAFKNLCNGRELDGDLLRQRRDFYAISLALIVFHLAGGGMRDSATLSTLPVKLAHPEVLYWSAWVSFAYFAWRFWVLDPGCLARFKEEWERQSRVTHDYYRVCLMWAKRGASDGTVEQRLRGVLVKNRPAFPEIAEGIPVSLYELRSLLSDKTYYQDGVTATPIEEQEIRMLRIAKARGLLRALFLERTASDLILPYVLGGLAVLSAVVAVATGHIPWRLS